MRLSDRIERLKHAASSAGSGRRPVTWPGTRPIVPLAQRLHHMTAARPAPRPSDAQVAALLGARLAAPGLVVAERAMPIEDRPTGVAPGALMGMPPVPWLPPVDAARLVFLDTETSGLAGGSGTIAFLVGIGRVDGATFRLRQYMLTAFRGEPAMLEEIAAQFENDAVVVSYNGKCFDVPLLETRYRLARQPNPLAGLAHVDLLYPTRTAYGRRWPDCRLLTAEERLLGRFREQDIPGAEIPPAWAAFLRRGVTEDLPAILSHNAEDLRALVALLPAVASAFAPPGVGDADALAIARSYCRAGRPDDALRRLDAARVLLEADGLLELARLRRKLSQPRLVA